MTIDGINITHVSDILRFEEGVRDFAYDDVNGKVVKAPVGNLSIGVGHNLQAKGISIAIINAILESDITDAWADVQIIYGDKNLAAIDEVRRSALVTLAFQLGFRRLREFTRMNSAIGQGDWSTAADELMASLLANQCTERTKRTSTLLRSGVYPAEYKI
jgi:lysozyme